MALDAVIFDLDGTLADTTMTHARAWEHAFRELGFEIPAERIALEIGKGGDRLVPALVGRPANDRYGEALRDRHLALYLELVKREGVRTFPRIRELFEALRDRGLKIALATAAKQESLDVTIEKGGLEDVIAMCDVVVNDSDVAESKPHPGAVQPAYEKLQLSPAQCVMVGDTVYDAEACRWAGLVCLGVTTGPHDEDALLDAGMRAVYRDTEDLLAHLDEALMIASPGSLVLTDERMSALMDQALEQARLGLSNGEFPIGCVVARGDGTVIGRGRSKTEGLGDVLAHAEIMAFGDARGRFRPEDRDLILVSTLEPCVMCFGAAMQARVDTIVYALEAPNNGGVGRCRPMQSPGMVTPRTVGGVCRAESVALLRDWLSRHPDNAYVKDLMERVGEPRLRYAG